jgi:chromosome segregation ATPase
MHTEIKRIEQEKADAIAEFKKNNEDDQDQLNREVNELKEKLLSATRIESKWINSKIAELERKKNRLENEIYRYDEQIAKK